MILLFVFKALVKLRTRKSIPLYVLAVFKKADAIFRQKFENESIGVLYSLTEMLSAYLTDNYIVFLKCKCPASTLLDPFWVAN